MHVARVSLSNASDSGSEKLLDRLTARRRSQLGIHTLSRARDHSCNAGVSGRDARTRLSSLAAAATWPSPRPPSTPQAMPLLAEAIGWKSVCALLESLERTREKKLSRSEAPEIRAWAERTVGRAVRGRRDAAVLLRLLHPLADSAALLPQGAEPLRGAHPSARPPRRAAPARRSATGRRAAWRPPPATTAATATTRCGIARVGFTSTVKGQGDLSAVIQSTIDERVGSLSGGAARRELYVSDIDGALTSLARRAARAADDGRAAGRDVLRALLSRCTGVEAKWFVRVLLRDLRISGCGEQRGAYSGTWPRLIFDSFSEGLYVAYSWRGDLAAAAMAAEAARARGGGAASAAAATPTRASGLTVGVYVAPMLAEGCASVRRCAPSSATM